MAREVTKTTDAVDIRLTEEQCAAIEKATGVRVSEITVVKHQGEAARKINPSLIAGVVPVLCW